MKFFLSSCVPAGGGGGERGRERERREGGEAEERGRRERGEREGEHCISMLKEWPADIPYL